MRHASDRFHVDVAGLNTELLEFVRKSDREHLHFLGLTDCEIKSIEAAPQVKGLLPYRNGRLVVQPYLSPKSQRKDSNESALSSSRLKSVRKSSSRAEEGAYLRELLISWAACVREIGLRSVAEAAIRLMLNERQVAYLIGATWPDLRSIVNGSHPQWEIRLRMATPHSVRMQAAVEVSNGD